MSALRLVGTGPLLAGVLPGPSTELKVHVQDVLASSGRLWLRGQVMEPMPPTVCPPTSPRWWKRRQNTSPLPTTTPTLQLQTRVSGHLLKAEVPLQPDGRFEVTFSADLPPARRGWRVACNHITLAGRATEACSLLLAPPMDAGAAVAIVLPWQQSFAADGPQQLERSDQAARLTALLRRLRDGRSRPSFFYLVCVGPGDENRVAEWALAVSALGWPTGQVLLLPVERARAGDALTHALDRLRWLFAGTLPLVVINQEPAAVDSLDEGTSPLPDRAEVRRLMHPTDDPAALFDSPADKPVSSNGHLRPTRSGLVTRYPLVFCHGMLAFRMLKM